MFRLINEQKIIKEWYKILSGKVEYKEAHPRIPQFINKEFMCISFYLYLSM